MENVEVSSANLCKWKIYRSSVNSGGIRDAKPVVVWCKFSLLFMLKLTLSHIFGKSKRKASFKLYEHILIVSASNSWGKLIQCSAQLCTGAEMVPVCWNQMCSCCWLKLEELVLVLAWLQFSTKNRLGRLPYYPSSMLLCSLSYLIKSSTSRTGGKLDGPACHLPWDSNNTLS